MNATPDALIFSTGKIIQIYAGVVGLCVAGNDTESFLRPLYGYDGTIPIPEDAWSSSALTKAECVELAAEMLKFWSAFRAKYAEPNAEGLSNEGI